jgi:gliding motility-associated-like protein
MDYKTTLMHFFTILGKWKSAMLIFLFSFLLLSAKDTQGQTLKTDSSVPVLDVCAESQQFAVRIAKGSQDCPNGELKIELPSGFELEAGSINIDGTPATITEQTGPMATMDINIPSGSSSQEIEITFKAKALCNIIGSSTGDPVVTYTLSGCTNGVQTGTSDAINIRYAVLRVNIAPNPITGNIGNEPERTITIKNQGNGEIFQFTLDRILGNGLSHVSYNYTSLTTAGWVIDDSNPDRLIFSGMSLKSGESITFKEKVKIEDCSLTPTDYEVYYGCATKCTASAVNGTATHIINLAVAGAPSLSVTPSSPVINCFNNFGANTWIVKNNGSTATDVIDFEISTQDLGGKIEPSSITVNGIPATIIDSSNPQKVRIQIPALTGGATATIVFEQYYPAPSTSAADCTSAPTQFSNGHNAFNASFDYTNSCAPVNSGGTVSEEISYNYTGMHIGEVDIIGGTPLMAEYMFTNFNIPFKGLNNGDQFVITVELSDDLSTTGFDFEGITAVNVGGNKWELTFTYGTAPWSTGRDLDFSFENLEFPITLTCPSTNLDDLWYRVGGELRKADGTGTCTPVVFKCNETKLKGFCPTGPCDDGLINGPAGVKRISLGHAVNGSGVPIVSTPSTNAYDRAFITGDILEIFQTSTARVTNGPFNTVRLVVEKEASTNATLRTTSGKIIINGTTVTSSATVTQTSFAYILEYTLPAPLTDGDEVRLSIEVKAGTSSIGLKRFPTKSYLIDTTTNEGLLCGRTYTATGLYVTHGFGFSGGTKNFVNCEENTNTATFSANILGFKKQDAIFKNEYRKLFVPTDAILKVPHYITLTGVTVTVVNQPWIANPTTTIAVLPAVNNDEYLLDLSAALKTITASSLGAGNGIDYLDEGFELKITPIVTLSECEPTTNATSQVIEVTLNGHTVDGEGLLKPYSNTQNLTYNTGIGTLALTPAGNSLFGTLSPDGTEVSWVVRVQSNGSRNFNSVWFAKKSGNLIIKSIQQVDDYNGANPQSALAANGANIYQLGDFTSGTAKYYLIKADVINCEVHSLTLTSGYSCTTASYPASINDGCKLNDLVLTHKTIQNILQTEVVDQFNGVNTKPDLCNEIWYSVQLHNAGDSQLDNLKISIPLNTAPGLAYNNKFEYSNVFSAAGGTASSWMLGDVTDAVINGGILEIKLPNSVKLNTLERVKIRVYYKVDNCDFRSGAKHTATPAATNTCGTQVTNITTATTKRIIIAGGSDSFPELREEGTTNVVLDPVLTTGGILRAIYNAEIKNSGAFEVNDPVTDQYQVALKLPVDWEIVGDPAAYLLPTDKVQYIALDPVRGYLYQVTSNINVGETLKFNNVPLKYKGSNITALNCHYNFGDIKVTVFQNIDVLPCAPNPDCSATGIDQVLYENIIPMELPIDTLLTIEPEYQYPEICNPSVNGGTPTLADIPFEGTTTVYHLDWYENIQEANSDLPADRLPLNTPLVDGRTYYVINRFIVDGVCKSNIGKIKVTFKENNLSGTVETICSVDNQTYQVKVTLTGTAPYTITGTGTPGTFNGNVWTSDPIVASTPYGAGIPYDFTITDANNCTPLNLTGAAPMCCTLEIECPNDIEIACGTNTDPSATGIPNVLKSCGNTNFVHTDSAISACTNGTKSFTRTFTVTDAQGNVETCEQIITIRDNVKPVFNEALPQNLTVSCISEVPAAVSLTATDNCGNAGVTFSESKTNGTCDNNFTITRTWTATDDCGNTTIHTQTITVNDDVNPTFVGTLPAATVTVSCASEVPEAATLTATDNCGTAVVDFDETITSGACDNNFTVTRTWTATDDCENTTTYQQIITVNDNIAPTITTKAQNVTVQCDGFGNTDALNSWLANNAGAIATDNCGTVNWSHDYDKDNFVTACGNSKSIEVTFTAADDCENTSTTTAVFTIEDTAKPVFTSDLPTDITVSCPAEIPAADNLTATDNCSGSNGITITVKDVISNVSPVCANNYTVTRTYTAEDACGNVATHTQIIKVEDKTKPVFVEDLPQNITYSCDAEVPTAPTLTANDNCGTATVDFKETRVDGSCVNSYVLTRTWTATDECGNTTTHKQTITVADTTAPVITLPASTTMTVECDGTGNTTEFDMWIANNGGATATDNCGTVSWSHRIEDTNDHCQGSRSIIVDFTATDSCGNSATFQGTFAIEDNTAPVIDTVNLADLNINCSSTSQDELDAWLNNHGGATANDLCGNIIWSHDYQGAALTCGRITTVTFKATDSCGNASTVTADIIFTDNEAPVFNGALPQNASYSCASQVPAAVSLTATDNCGNAGVTFSESKTNGTCDNNFTITRTWTATDDCGNTTIHTQTITVNDDVNPTFVGTLPAATVTVSCASEVPEAATLTATDNCGTAVVDFDETITSGACDNNFTVTRTWTATDDCENTTTYQQIITVNDNIAPTITTKAQNVTVQCDGFGNTDALNSWLANNAGAIATDNCGTVNWSHDYDKDNFVTACGNSKSIEVTFTAADDCENTSTTTAVFTIEDTAKPVFTSDLPTDITVSCPAEIPAADNLTATDNCSGSNGITITVKDVISNVSPVCANNYTVTRTYTAEDACGNVATHTQIIKVEDKTKPVFVEDLPQNITYSCDAEVPTAPTLTANDNCGTATVDFKETRVDGSCVNSYVLTRTWTATDECGNTTTHKQTITVVDTTKPVFVEALPQNITYSCDAEVPTAPTLTANDNCGTAAVDFKETRVDGSCANSYVLTRTWTATDECENTTTHTQTITVADTTKPVFVEALPQNITYSCDAEVPTAPTLTANDNCGTAAVDFKETRVDGSCANSYVLTRTWTAKDECENTTTHTQTITVADTTKPVFTVEPKNKVVECDGLGNLDGPDGFHAWLASNAGAEATDNCGNVTISYLIEDTNTICGGSGTIIVDFIAKDECGNFTIKQATYAIFDRTPPTIDTPAANLVIECSINGEDELNAWLSNHGGAIATDTCGLITWSHNYQGSLAICSSTPTEVTFTATDACGNSSETKATVQVVDTIIPTLVKEAQNKTVECDGLGNGTELQAWLANHAGAEANDSCSVVTWTNDYNNGANFVPSCGSTGSVAVTFTGSDVCGNQITTTATFTIKDTKAPVLVTPAQNKTVECAAGNDTELQTWLANNGGATATDTCSNAALTWTNDYGNGEKFISSCGNTGEVTVTFTVKDDCGNSISTVAKFTIVDTTKPIFDIEPQNATVECDGTGNIADYDAWLASYAGAAAKDNCGTVSYSYTLVDTAVLCGNTNQRVVRFTATDECGNRISKQATFTIQDTTAPNMIEEAADIVIECGNDENTQIATWLNNHGGALSTDTCSAVTWTHNYNGLTVSDCGNTGSALVTFTVTDACGNESTTQATVSVVDTTAPTLTKPAQDLTVQCGTNTTQALNNWLANHAGAEASDSCSIVTWTNDYNNGANFAPSCGSTGSVAVTFTGSDACGNQVTTTATFTIEDTTAPVLVTPAQNKTVECAADNETELQAWLANNGGATATDTCSTAALTWTNDYGNGEKFISSCGNTGEVTVTFTVKDDCGNSISTVAKFTIVDTTKPVFDIEPQNATVECDGTGNTADYDAWLASYAGAVATDNCSEVTYTYTIIDTAALCGKTNKTVVSFTATDACGNSISKQATFTIQDTTAPEFITDAKDLVIECDGTGNNSDLTAWLNNRAGATATDTCSSELTWSHNFSGLTKACGATGSTEVTFTVTDACGNTSEQTATFTIVDTTAPVFNVNLPQDRTIECSNGIPEIITVTADDLCSKATVNFREERIDGNCPNSYELIRTWTATDECGNTTEHVQVITVQDTTAPEFIGELPKEEIFIRCEDLKQAETLKAIDNCGPVEVTAKDEVIPGDCDTKYTIIRTWTATDSCGNETSFTQKINLSCQIEVYNAVTPNGDGFNDEFALNGIECYPGNTVQIFNRWGVLVYETKDYNSYGNVFRGYSNGRGTVNGSSMLPTGTYYYVISYDFDLGNGEVYPIQQAGYLHLETNK